MAKTQVGARRDDAPPAFEDILARLGDVVERLESGELPLEASLELFEEGVRLSKLGAARLDDAERRIERLLNDDGDTAPAELREKETESP
jgi:exodeoxyribonuclease VII small subunit